MQANECVTFLVIKDDKILLEKRSEQKESDPGLIAIPGGHIETGEDHKQALVRELKEELNLVPLSFEYLCTLYHPATTELQLIHYYIIKSWSGKMATLEAEEVFWHTIENAPVDIEADKVALAEYRRLAKYQSG